MSPLPNTSVIPDGWASRVIRSVGEAAMRGTCTLHAGATGPAPWPLPDDWSEDGETLTPVPVRCRVQRVNRATASVQAEQRQETREYQVTIPVSVCPDLMVTDTGPWVRVVSSPDDPHAAGLRLKVLDVYYGTEVADRVLICVHNQTQD